MSNLGIFKINTNKTYQKVSDLTGINFVAGSKYQLQVQTYNGEPFYFCVDSVLPTSGGFKVGLDPFSYTVVEGSDLYVYTHGEIYLNIAV